MRDLHSIREDIDQTDKELTRLLEQRMGYSKEVAVYKAAHGLPILNAKREEQVLERIAKQSKDEYEGINCQVFMTIMELSRGLQQDMLGCGKDLKNSLLRAANNEIHVNSGTTIACQGIPGANSHTACQNLFPQAKIEFCGDFEDAFKAVEQNRAEFAVLPLENSFAGSVTEVYDLILKYRFYIALANEEIIRHCLAGTNRIQLGDVKEVISHPQALAQCENFISAHGYKKEKSSNTAIAAREVAAKNEDGVCAICSAQAAKEYGLEIIENDIQDSANNRTRFIVISKELFIPQNADKISLCFSIPHVTGSLYSVLSRFSARGLNLTKIESRPSKSKGFEYMFYLDFKGNVKKPEVLNLLCALSEELPAFSFLGNYEEKTI